MADQEIRDRSNRRCAFNRNHQQEGTIQKALFGLIIIAILMSACATTGIRQGDSSHAVQQASSCPAAGTVVPLKKVMNPSFIRDYQGCDIVVEATFLKMGNEGYALEYNTSANTTFQVLEPGGAAQASLGGMSFGIFAGVPKAQSDVLFDLKQGDLILLRGAPIGHFWDGNLVGAAMGGNLLSAVFHATVVTRK